MMDDENLEDTFKILLATDNHLGYAMNHPIRENDTFVTFEEILKIAVRENVDFILLGGDLFHDTSPSPYCINTCTELIRKYCLSDKPVEIEFLSDASISFCGKNDTVNYEDPNMNIGIPIFSIHGNHDDPTGKRRISALDLLASAGLVNYFGRWDDVSQVEVNPILLKKGETCLALYGLSHIRDERLARLFIEKKVTFKILDNVDDWFNMLVLHQNRANRGVKNFIAESFIPNFIDLVMWGHEHDCRIDPESINEGKNHIIQPGSSVATSLSEGEAARKHVGILKVCGKRFTLDKIELHTVRPFIFRTLVLDPPEGVEGKVSHADRSKQKITLIVDEMLREARALGRRRDLIPLIRLVVRYPDERQVFNTIRFGQGYVDKVANTDDMVKFSAIGKKRVTLDGSALIEVDEAEVVDRVEDLLPKYFNETNQLKVLSLNGLNAAVKKFIEASDAEAVSYLVNYQQKATLTKLNEMKPDEEDLEEVLEQLRVARQPANFNNVLNDPIRQRVQTVRAPPTGDDQLIISDDSDEGERSSVPVTPKSGRGSRAARRPRGGRGSRSRGK